MSPLMIGQHNNVVYAGSTVKLFGSTLQTYVYVTGGLLVDTGPSKFRRAYASFFGTQNIQNAVLTHFHEDHSGNAPWLNKSGVRVYIYPPAVPLCREKAKLPIYRRIFWGGRDAFIAFPIDSSLSVEKKTFKVIETPGHSFDHITLFDSEDGAVYTGDLFVSPKTKLIMKYENIPQIINSLRSVLEHDFQTVYCGHAGVVEEGRKMVQRKLDYLENMRGEVLELFKKGFSITAIDKKIFTKTPSLTYISGREWASEHIVRSIIEGT